MQNKEERNAYHRKRYALNIEKERKRSKEKYHRNKKKLCDLDEEKKQHIKAINRRNYENWRIRQGKEVKVKKETNSKNQETIPMKKFRLPERITHKYVSYVLRKFPKSRLCNVLISSWKIGELTEFEELEKLLTENK